MKGKHKSTDHLHYNKFSYEAIFLIFSILQFAVVLTFYLKENIDLMESAVFILVFNAILYTIYYLMVLKTEDSKPNNIKEQTDFNQSSQKTRGQVTKNKNIKQPSLNTQQDYSQRQKLEQVNREKTSQEAKIGEEVNQAGSARKRRERKSQINSTRQKKEEANQANSDRPRKEEANQANSTRQKKEEANQANSDRLKKEEANKAGNASNRRKEANHAIQNAKKVETNVKDDKKNSERPVAASEQKEKVGSSRRIEKKVPTPKGTPLEPKKMQKSNDEKGLKTPKESEILPASPKKKPIKPKITPLSKDEVEGAVYRSKQKKSEELFQKSEKSVKPPKTIDNDNLNKSIKPKNSNKPKISYKPKITPFENESSGMFVSYRPNKNRKTTMYHIQTNKDEEIQEIEMDSEATVKNMKEKIAKMYKVKNVGSIRILFAGKVLRDNITLESLEVGDFTLFVYIRSDEDINLQTAKALQVNNDEYYSEYEVVVEEEEEDI
ncbi:hypothetical protein M9Y10_041958 [Tritrichomonas musculus]|uniref:Ubiquitin-like domain-containing protein n=1 Tax=Tritrichomonas musculus TaxID=1915356 RepID=A0ABR2K5Y2_9EUKA